MRLKKASFGGLDLTKSKGNFRSWEGKIDYIKEFPSFPLERKGAKKRALPSLLKGNPREATKGKIFPER